MGREIVSFLQAHPNHNFLSGIDLGNSIEESFSKSKPDLLIDFTHPKIRMETVFTSLSHRVPLVVGTTGFTSSDLEKIQQWVTEFNVGCFIAPNFIIGNVLMQKFAKKASLYYENAEIIEYHHEQKADFPSGTAVKTAELMSQNRKKFNKNVNDQVANIEGARGGNFKGIRLHSVRMPGFIASQEVILGNEGEYLTIRHDSINRQSYMKGIFMAVDYIAKHCEFIYGLEHIL